MLVFVWALLVAFLRFLLLCTVAASGRHEARVMRFPGCAKASSPCFCVRMGAFVTGFCGTADVPGAARAVLRAGLLCVPCWSGLLCVPVGDGLPAVHCA